MENMNYKKSSNSLLGIVSKLIGTLFALGLIFLLMVSYGRDIVAKDALAYKEQKTFEDIGVDVVIQNPGKAQVESELEKEFTDIDSIEPFYLFYCKVNNNLSEEIVLFDDFDNLENTPYASSRIMKGEIKKESNSVIIDHTMSERYGLDVGDTVWIGFGGKGDGEDFTVCAITFDNILVGDKGSFAVQYTGKQKELVESSRTEELEYSAAYLRAKDGKCEELLAALKDTYLPMADAPDPSDFELDTEYQMFLNNFKNADHSYLVEDTANKMDQELIDGWKNDITFKRNLTCIFIALGILLTGLLITSVMRKRIRSDMEKYSFGTVFKRYAPIWRPLLMLILGVGIIIGMAVINSLNFAVYYSIEMVITLLAPILIVYGISVLVSYVIDVVLLRYWRP